MPPRMPVVWAMVLTAGGALAQAPSHHEPAAAAPQSALDAYRPYREAELVDWREANERVGRIGGWRSYLKEVEEHSRPAPSPASGEQPGPAGRMQMPHDRGMPHDHRMHRGGRR